MKKTLLLSIIFFIGFFNFSYAQNTSCLSFDGYNDYVRYADDATLGRMDGATDYTIEAWVYPNSSTVAEYDRVLQRYYSFAIVMYDGNNDGNVEDWYFEIWDNNDNAHFFNTQGDATLSLDSWNHIAVINDSGDGTLKLFVDGVDVTSSGGYSNMDLRPSQSSDNLYIGSKRASTPNNSFGGKIDEVRLKNVAEYPGDLQSQTTDPPYTSDSHTAALFHFDENSGTTTVNEASSSNATLNNGVAWSDVNGLPMETTQALDLISFSANKYNNYVQLNWETAFDITGKEFKIQRSSDLKNWKEIGVLPYSIQKDNYSFIDDQPLRKNYYRIQTLDFDGISTYSKVLSISISENTPISISPNPVKDVIYVSGIDEKSQVQYKVYNTFGEKIQQEITNGIIRLKKTVQGMYFLQIKGETKKFIVK